MRHMPRCQNSGATQQLAEVKCDPRYSAAKATELLQHCFISAATCKGLSRSDKYQHHVIAAHMTKVPTLTSQTNSHCAGFYNVPGHQFERECRTLQLG